jgi:hypothetical protein
MQTYAEQITAYDARRAVRRRRHEGDHGQVGRGRRDPGRRPAGRIRRPREGHRGDRRPAQAPEEPRPAQRRDRQAVGGANDGRRLGGSRLGHRPGQGRQRPQGHPLRPLPGRQVPRLAAPPAERRRHRQADAGRTRPEVEIALRSAIAAGTTTDTTNAGPLVVQQNIASEFAQLLVPGHDHRPHPGPARRAVQHQGAARHPEPDRLLGR